MYGAISYKKLLIGLIGFGALALVSSCQKKDAKIDPLAGGGGLSGSWVSGDNVFTAKLNNGTFISVANDTGETLSEGTYIVISAAEVRLNWTGRVSQQTNQANCQRQGETLMNCTDQAGRTFTLQKTSSVAN